MLHLGPVIYSVYLVAAQRRPGAPNDVTLIIKRDLISVLWCV
jgi:hypothetical protein